MTNEELDAQADALCQQFNCRELAEKLVSARAECLRLQNAEAEAMAVVLSQKGKIKRMLAEIEAARNLLDEARSLGYVWRDHNFGCSGGCLRDRIDAYLNETP